MERMCTIDGCSRSEYGTSGYCEMHYRRVRKTGDPGPAGPVRERGTCRVDGCDAETDARGLCHAHYQRLMRNGTANETRPIRGRNRAHLTCSVDGCDRPAGTRGHCSFHYRRLLKYGDALADAPIPDSDGTGHMSHGYIRVSVPQELRHLSGGKSQITEHRLVMAIRLRRALASDEHVHHLNGIRTDNRLENLELWSTYHPKGSRVEDLLEYGQAILTRYENPL